MRQYGATIELRLEIELMQEIKLKPELRDVTGEDDTTTTGLAVDNNTHTHKWTHTNVKLTSEKRLPLSSGQRTLAKFRLASFNTKLLPNSGHLATTESSHNPRLIITELAKEVQLFSGSSPTPSSFQCTLLVHKVCIHTAPQVHILLG